MKSPVRNPHLLAIFLTAVVSVVVIVAMPLSAMAAETDMPDTYLYVGGHVGQYYYDFNSHEDNRGLTQTTLPGVQIGWRFAPHWSIQGSWERNEYSWEDSNIDGSMNVTLISGRYHFNKTHWFGFEPYVGLASGEIRLAPDNSSETDRQTLVGPEAGAQTMLLPYLSLDVGARPLWRMDSKSWDGEVFAAINFIFGTAPVHVETQQAMTAASATAAPMMGAAKAGDADGDGVPDNMDKCASTPAGMKVNADGCERDTDGDGVVDDKDKCPNTPTGALVDVDGCQKMLSRDIRQTLHVQFSTGKAKVAEGSYPEVERIARLAKQYPSAQLLLDGYTDSVGAAVTNQRLSEERATAVRDLLVNHFGVAASQVVAKGHGEANPVASNKTAAGRAQNRRVEVILKAEALEKQ
jgi:OOP family OmpA-OmpF porin